MTRRNRSDRATRRTVLKATGIAGVTAGLGGLAAGQETTEEEDGEGETETTAEGETTTAEGDDATTIILGGEVGHWFGLAPEPIHEAENPTLRLEEGERYEIIWINLDGQEHELIVEDADGEELAASDSNEEAGATASVTITASEEMAEYYCEYHPESMRGSVELGEGFETTADETETETETTAVGDETETTEEGDEDDSDEDDSDGGTY